MLKGRETGVATCTASGFARFHAGASHAFPDTMRSAPCWGKHASPPVAISSSGYQRGCVQKLFMMFYCSCIIGLLIFAILDCQFIKVCVGESSPTVSVQQNVSATKTQFISVWFN